MKALYPVIITKGKKFFIASVPDLEIDTQGVDMADAIEMVRDAIALWIVCEQDAKREVPEPSDMTSFEVEKGDVITLVDVDVDAYRRRLENRTVRKNLTIPSWLNEQAEQAGINFSAVLQKALKNELHIAE